MGNPRAVAIANTFDPETINMDALIQGESSGKINAYNSSSGARGLAQITPIALKDYNQLNPKEQYTLNDLYDPQVNQRIAYWLLTQRIPQQLSAAGLPVTEENIIQTYHDGIGNMKKGRSGPESRGYLPKYQRLKAIMR